MTDDNGQAYLPPQGGYDVTLQAPSLTVLPGVGHSGPPTAPPAAAKPDQSPTGGSPSTNTDGVDPVDDVRQPSQSPPIESPLGKAVDDLLNLRSRPAHAGGKDAARLGSAGRYMRPRTSIALACCAPTWAVVAAAAAGP